MAGAEKFDEDAFDWETRQESTPLLHHAIAGSSAGIMEHVSMFPLDTIKTRMQASRGALGVREAARAVLEERGGLGFIRGAHVIGFGCIPSHIGLFGIYEYSMSKFVDRQEHQPLRTAACGALAAVFHDGVLTPHDTVKQRLQLGRYNGAIDCITSVFRTEGVRAFYRSLPATLAMNVPFTALVTACNESLQLVLGSDNDSILTTVSGYFLCAGLSGGVAAALTSPFDVVKTRLQTQYMEQNAGGIFTLVRNILRHEGARGLFRGTLPRVVLAAPAAAVSWGTYETVRLALQRRTSQKNLNERRFTSKRETLTRCTTATRQLDSNGDNFALSPTFEEQNFHSKQDALRKPSTILRPLP